MRIVQQIVAEKSICSYGYLYGYYIQYFQDVLWEKIEKLLKEKSMTENKLAKLAGINKNSLIDLKMGRKKSLKFEDVVKIADALDISLDEFRKE